MATAQQQALSWLDRAVESDPTSAEAYLLRARFHRLVRRDVDAARTDLEAARQLDTEDPIGWGMPRRAAALFMSGPAFGNEDGGAIASYATGDPLLSGLLIGPDKIAGQGAIVRVPIGEGQVVLFGFRPHFRAQARGTYKLLFNALYSSVLCT